MQKGTSPKMNRHDFLIRSATLIGAALLPMPEAVGVTTWAETVPVKKRLGIEYAELAKHFKYDIQFVPLMPAEPARAGWLATITGKLQDKEEADWIAAEYLEYEFDLVMENLEGAMHRRYIEIAHRDN
jgi:hypothetical protein